MGIVLALGAALAYGLSDFLGGALSRRSSSWPVALVAQLVGAVGVTLAALRVPADPTGTELLWGAASGVGSGLGTAFLYRGLAAGAMNVVAPLSAVGAALMPVVVGVSFGERPGATAWVGVGCALPAIWLVSRAGRGGASNESSAAGVRDGLLAGASFGLLFVALGQVPSAAGLWPLALGQGVGLVVISTGAVLAGASVRRVRRPVLAVSALVGLASATATLLYQLAVRSQLVSLTAVVTSLYPALTVALAALVLHERVSRTQGVGLGLAAAAVALVSLG